MLVHDLLILIGQGEGPKLEFRRDGERPETIAGEMAAFANIDGGTVLVGVDDDGEIAGIHRSNLHEWLMDTVIGKHIHPFILPDYDEVKIEGKKVAVVTVPQGHSKPYVVRRQGREDIYVRDGDATRLAKREQVVRLYLAGGWLSAEKFPVHGSAVEELDERRCREYFENILQLDLTDSDQNPSGDILREMLIDHDFLVGDPDPCSCSYFSYALFAQKPGRLAQARARLTVFSGLDKEYSNIFDKMYEMPLLEYRGEGGMNDPVEPALHQRMFDDIRSYASHEELQGTVRVRIWDYPEEAIRELLINALTHRDWTKQNYVRVVLYSDRMEITSPGSLPDGMTIEKIKNGAQSQRNPISNRIFRNYGYLEDLGLGIRHKVIPQMEQHNGCGPEFEATEDHLKVTLRKKPLGKAPDREREFRRIPGQKPFETLVAAERLEAEEVLNLLDYAAYFDLLKFRSPANRKMTLDALSADSLVQACPAGGWNITNLGAILLARRLADFPDLERKEVRVIQYRGADRTEPIREQSGTKGYAVGFNELVDYINGLLPRHEIIQQAIRETVTMYPDLAVRELVANMLTHQDFQVTGAGPTVEIFEDRIEIANPGKPLVSTDRFVDTPPMSRNHGVASLMHRFRLCGERGSGIDEVVRGVELHRLPAPLFEVSGESTRAVLFAYRPFKDTDKSDRIRACYLHACLCHVTRRRMTNATLRERLGIATQNASSISRVLREALNTGKIVIEDESVGARGRAYLPFWAKGSGIR